MNASPLYKYIAVLLGTSYVAGMDWQTRTRFSGLTQHLIAQIAGRSGFQISQQMTGKVQGGVPRYVQSIILAWEVMSVGQRQAWLDAIEALPAAPKVERPNNLPKSKKSPGRPPGKKR